MGTGQIWAFLVDSPLNRLGMGTAGLTAASRTPESWLPVAPHTDLGICMSLQLCRTQAPPVTTPYLWFTIVNTRHSLPPSASSLRMPLLHSANDLVASHLYSLCSNALLFLMIRTRPLLTSLDCSILLWTPFTSCLRGFVRVISFVCITNLLA